MIDRRDLEIAMKELEDLPPTYQTCSKLADLYIILDHLKQHETTSYSETHKVSRQATMFLQATEGKDINKVLEVMDELMEATQILNPRLYEATIERIKKL